MDEMTKSERMLHRALQAAINLNIDWLGAATDKYGIIHSVGIAYAGRKHNEEFTDILFIKTSAVTVVDYLSEIRDRVQQEPENLYNILLKPFVELALKKRYQAIHQLTT